ncbi:MAG: hypothetical protein RR386_05845 [Bacteroidaceae bacterium]
MISTSIDIKKSSVYDEVAKLTSYVGTKMMFDSKDSYEKIFTTDDDRLLLERFWRESLNLITNTCKNFISSVSSSVDNQTIDMQESYLLVLSMPSSYDSNLSGSLRDAIFSFIVYSITSKWFSISNKEDTLNYLKESSLLLEEIRSKLYFKKKPIRTVPN